MRIRRVVTCFLQHPRDGTVLLGRRSEKVRTYPGLWAAVSGSVEEETPPERALLEIEEETGLGPEAVEQAAEGPAVRFPDWELETLWVVHPFLFRCRRPERVRRDWEHMAFEWTDPGRILFLKTVPRLAGAWDTVRRAAEHGGRLPAEAILKQLEGDREHGAEELGLRVLSALLSTIREARRNGATTSDARRRLRACCRRAALLRPAMAAPLTAALDGWLAAGQTPHGEPPGAGEAEQKIETLIRTREEACLAAAARAGERIGPGERVVTLSRSSTVLMALKCASDRLGRLTVAESRPACEGRRSASEAASFGLEVELVTDAVACSRVREAQMVLLGANAVAADGSVANKSGSFALAAAARAAGRRTVVAAAASKRLPRGHRPRMEKMDPSELGEPIEGVLVENPYFEWVPAGLVEEVVTERSPAGEARLQGVAERRGAAFQELAPGF